MSTVRIFAYRGLEHEAVSQPGPTGQISAIELELRMWFATNQQLKQRCIRNCDSETNERKNMVAEVGLEPT